MLSFNESGLVAPATADIRAEVAQVFVDAFAQKGLPNLNTDPETPAGQLVDSIAAMIADKNAEILYLANQFNPLTASGLWQKALGQIYFIEPFTSRASVATCLCTGLTGTQIPAGALIRSNLDQTIWVSLNSATITTNGTVSVQFQCQQEGPIAAAEGTLTEIVTVTPGWDTVTNATAILGTNAETQKAFELRRYNAVAANARGSVSALYGALSKLDGVIDVAVLENITSSAQTIQGVSVPAHSVWITIVGGTEDDIAETIYRKKDAGCGTGGNTAITYTDSTIVGNPVYSYNINRPVTLDFGFKVTLRKTATTPNNIVELIQDAILNDFNGGGSNVRVGTAQTVYASRFYAPAVNAGATDLISVEICAPATGGAWGTSVFVTANQEPALDVSNISVNVLES